MVHEDLKAMANQAQGKKSLRSEGDCYPGVRQILKSASLMKLQPKENSIVLITSMSFMLFLEL